MRAKDVWGLSRAELATVLTSGFAVDVEALRGASFRGVSLGLPGWVERLSWKEFRKEMFTDEATGAVVGRNVRVTSRAALVALEDGGTPPSPELQNGAPKVFGPFGVRPLRAGEGYPCSAGVVLDYGLAHPALVRAEAPLTAPEGGASSLRSAQTGATLAPWFHPLARLRDPVVALREGSTELLLGASYLSLGSKLVATPSFFTLERES